MREYSPFSTSVPIRGREAQRLYLAIDGRKSLAELALLTKLNLHLLVEQDLIQVCFFNAGYLVVALDIGTLKE